MIKFHCYVYLPVCILGAILGVASFQLLMSFSGAPAASFQGGQLHQEVNHSVLLKDVQLHRPHNRNV